MKQANRSQLLAKSRWSACLDAAAEYGRSLWQEEDGQDLVEYSLLLGFIAVGSMATLNSAGGSIKGLWDTVNKDLSNAVAAAS